MPIDTPCKEYEAASRKWQRCRDVIAGGDAVKASKEVYVLKPSGMDRADYEVYVSRPEFFNATARTVHGMSGAVMRREPTKKAPAPVEKLFTDVTRNGRSLDNFAQDTLEEDLRVGRCGVLVDMPPEGTENARPYWVLYKAEQIINWRVRVAEGRRVLVLVVLEECSTQVSPDDPYVLREVKQYRELRLGAAGIYEVVIWTEKERKDGDERVEYVPGPTLFPTRRGESLPFIPFTFVNPAHRDPEIDDAPLQDLVDVNLSHFRTSCDYEHGAHYTACPMPWAVGVPKGENLKMGSGVAWILNDGPNSKAGMLEYTGQGLQGLDKLVDRKEKRMAVLGARLLEQAPTHVETAEAVRLRQRGDESVMVRLANTVSSAMTQALQWTTWWMTTGKLEVIDAEVAAVTLNTDLIETKMAPEELTALMAAFQGGGMSFESLFWNMQQGERMPPKRTLEEEKAAIDEEERARLELTKEELEAQPRPIVGGGGGGS
jgi:hypothetical protein